MLNLCPFHDHGLRSQLRIQLSVMTPTIQVQNKAQFIILSSVEMQLIKLFTSLGFIDNTLIFVSVNYIS